MDIQHAGQGLHLGLGAGRRQLHLAGGDGHRAGDHPRFVVQACRQRRQQLLEQQLAGGGEQIAGIGLVHG
ncbi:hypothetical protein D3C84_1229050 [compost metagenome]